MYVCNNRCMGNLLKLFLRLSSGAGDGPQRSLLVSAEEDRGARRRLARPAEGGLDERVLARLVHELPGVLQRRGASGPPAGPLPAPGLPPQRLPRSRHGPGSAQGRSLFMDL